MTATTDPQLQSALTALALPGIMVGHRLISAGDEYALMPRESSAFANHVLTARRASGAVRLVAREFLAQLGRANYELLKAPSGAPVWPADVTGSLAHDFRVAIAAVGRRQDVRVLGIDIEPAEPLPSDRLELVTTPNERRRLDLDPFGGRRYFVAKEAVYKAVFQLDQTFLEHHDIEVDFSNCKAVTRTGRSVDLKVCIASHLVVLAVDRP